MTKASWQPLIAQRIRCASSSLASLTNTSADAPFRFHLVGSHVGRTTANHWKSRSSYIESVKRCWSSASSTTFETEYRPSFLASTPSSSSSLPFPDNNHGSSSSIWNETIHRLLNLPIGSFTDVTWEEADQALRFGTSSSSSNNNNNNADDGSGVHLLFQLLDRLVQEEIVLVKFDPINAIVLRWRNSILRANNQQLQHRQHHSSPKRSNKESGHDPNQLLLPSEVVAKLDSWRDKIPWLQPDTKTYTMILEAAASLPNNDHHPLDGVLFADSLLEWMISESSKTHTSARIRPTTVTFAAVLNAWAWSDRLEACDKVEQWMQCLDRLHQEGWPDLQPNVVLYNIRLNTWARAGRVDRALEILQQMMKNQDSDDNNHHQNAPIRPDQTSFTTVLSAYAKPNNNPKAAHQAQVLLDKMQEWYDAGTSAAKPNAFSYTAVMKNWAMQGDGSRAEQVLQRLEEAYRKSSDPDLKPDVLAYNTVLLGWVRAQRPDQAERLLQTIYEKGEVLPNQTSFNTVLAAWAKVGAVDEAEAILTTMHDISREGDNTLDIRADVVSYNTVLDAWAKESKNRPDAWKRSQAILHHMEDLYRAGDVHVKPNATTWNTVMNCAAEAGKSDAAERLMGEFQKASAENLVDGVPSVRTWNTLLSACLKKGDAHRAKRMLDQMKATAGKWAVEPDIISYNTVLHCFARSNHRDAGDEAMALFRQMEEDRIVQPNRISYLALINAWIKGGKPNQAETALMRMIQDGVDLRQGGLDIFHKIMAAWSRHQAPRKAEALLFKMVDLSNSSHRMYLRPTVETYNRILNSWAKAKVAEAGERADLVLRQMEDLANAGDSEAAPDVVSYNSVLNAWANSGDQTAVTRTEHLVLEMILKGDAKVTPTEVTYGTWLKTIESSGMGDKARRTREVLKTMKIHNFEPSEFLLKKIEKLKSMRN
jgi:pentatricopeptide repeat protein